MWGGVTAKAAELLQPQTDPQRQSLNASSAKTSHRGRTLLYSNGTRPKPQENDALNFSVPPSRTP